MSTFFFLKMDKAFIKTKKEIQIHKGLQKQNQHRRIKLNKHPNGLTMKGKGGLHPSKAGKNLSCEHNEPIHEPQN